MRQRRNRRSIRSRRVGDYAPELRDARQADSTAASIMERVFEGLARHRVLRRAGPVRVNKKIGVDGDHDCFRSQS